MWTRILSMNTNRLPKICYLELLKQSSGDLSGNWALNLKKQLHSLSLTSVWEAQESKLSKNSLQHILEAFKNNSILKDTNSIINPSRFNYYTQLKTNQLPEKYLNNPNIPIHITRVFSQLRLNTDTLRIKNKIHYFNLENQCPLCQSNPLGSFRHFFLQCPSLKNLRIKFLPNININNFHTILNCDNNALSLFNFTLKIFLNFTILTNIP